MELTTAMAKADLLDDFQAKYSQVFHGTTIRPRRMHAHTHTHTHTPNDARQMTFSK